jgi:hypothetical protein
LRKVVCTAASVDIADAEDKYLGRCAEFSKAIQNTEKEGRLKFESPFVMYEHMNLLIRKFH